MKDKIRLWVEVVSGAIKEGLNPEETGKRIMGAKEFSDIPKKGPVAGFVNMNVEALYKILSK